MKAAALVQTRCARLELGFEGVELHEQGESHKGAVCGAAF
jgi:hypothetical protein